jgi:hypothetical protein
VRVESRADPADDRQQERGCIDFDQNFGKASDATRVRAGALWRITPAHYLRFLDFDNRTTRSRVIDRDVQWGDYTFQAGGLVESEVKFRISSSRTSTPPCASPISS